MNHRFTSYITLLFALLLLVACSNYDGTQHRRIDGSVKTLIDSAEVMAAEHSNEALAMLHTIDISSLRSEADRARYALVLSEAYYYNYIAIESDTLLRPMMEYYRDRSTNHDERARALYQYALVRQTMGDNAEAMVSLMEAEKSLSKISNNRLQGLTHRVKGDIYSDECLYGNAYDAYKRAKECFDADSLMAHSAHATLQMGIVALLERDYSLAESLLIEVRDYAIMVQDTNFLCKVLHELCDLYIYTDNISSCNATLDLFDRYKALLFDYGHYYSVCAITAAANQNRELAEHYLQEAERYDDVPREDIAYTKYLVYRMLAMPSKALQWLEVSKNTQDRLLLGVLDNPVLNVQVDLLQRNLDSERRAQALILRNEQERQEFRRERNTIIISIVTLLLLCALSIAVVVVRRHIRQKNLDIQQYIATINELQMISRAVPEQMSIAIGELYRDRFSELNNLCDIYYDHSGSSRQKNMVFDKVCQTIDKIKNDEANIAELERAVNTYRGNIMARLREQMPRLGERDIRVSLYSFAGFSNRAIALFLDSDPVTISKWRYNLKTKISRANVKDVEFFVKALSEK